MDTYLKAVAAAAIGGGLVWLLDRRIPAERFRAMKWAVPAGTALLWSGFVAVLVTIDWEVYFAYIKPPWSRWALPFLVMPFYGLVSLAFWWAASRTRRPAVTFCALGALWAIPEHLLGIYRMHILDIPLLAGETVLSILTFSIFEYLIVWAAALGLAAGLFRLWPKRRPA